MDQSALVMSVCLLPVGLLYCCMFILENIKRNTIFSKQEKIQTLLFWLYFWPMSKFSKIITKQKRSVRWVRSINVCKISGLSDRCALLKFTNWSALLRFYLSSIVYNTNLAVMIPFGGLFKAYLYILAIR